MKRMSVALALIAALTATSGCTAVCYVQTRVRVRRAAGDAWVRFCDHHDCIDHADDIEDGFKSGYKAFIYAGHPGPPPILPSKYYRPWYQTTFGRHEIDAWREGYQFGQHIAAHHAFGGPCARCGPCAQCGPEPGLPGAACEVGCACGPPQLYYHHQNGAPPGFLPTQPGFAEPYAAPVYQTPVDPAPIHPAPIDPAPGPASPMSEWPETAHPPESPVLPPLPPEVPKETPPAAPAQPNAPAPAPAAPAPEAPAAPSATLELPHPTAEEVTPEEAAMDPPQTEVPARSASTPGPVDWDGLPDVPPVPEHMPSLNARRWIDPAPERGPRLMTPEDLPHAPPPPPATIARPAGLPSSSSRVRAERAVETPPVSFGRETPGRVMVTNDPFAEPAPSEPLPANRGWKPLEWKPTRTPSSATQQPIP